MSFFPFFEDIENRRCLVVGAGNVAFRKIEKLMGFGVEITVVAPKISENILSLPSIVIHQKYFEPCDLDTAELVISATNDLKVSEQIFKLCTERSIPVNTVDDKEKCTFIFPALIHDGDITIGITTNGKSPLYAKYLREKIETLLDEENKNAFNIIAKYRPLILKKISSENTRRIAQEQLLELMISENISDENDKRILNLIEKIGENYEN